MKLFDKVKDKLFKETSTKIFFVIIIIYIAGMIIGAFFPERIRWHTILHIAESSNGKSYSTLYYFLNNFNVSYLAIMGGAFTGGLYTVYICFFNGYIVGYAIKLLIPFNQQFLLLPHGIFEVPALIISCTMPLKFWVDIIKKRSIKHIHQAFIDHILNLRTWAIILILLLIAAIIESEITPLFI